MTAKPSDCLVIAEADRHIGAAEKQVAKQELRLTELRHKGQDTGEAERLLTNLQGLLAQFRAHREQIAGGHPPAPPLNLADPRRTG